MKEEGGIFTLTNAPIAMRMGKINELAKACNAEVIPADATSEGDLQTLFTKSMELLGGKLDFVLHSIGMSPNVRKNKDYSGGIRYKTGEIYEQQKTFFLPAIEFIDTPKGLVLFYLFSYRPKSVGKMLKIKSKIPKLSDVALVYK